MFQLQKRGTLHTQLPLKEIYTLQWEEISQPHWFGRGRRTRLWNAGCPRTRLSGISLCPTRVHACQRPDATDKRNGSLTGFSLGLIRLALVRQINSNDVYLSARKSMTLWFYIWSIAKRAEGVALIDSRATKNLMNLDYIRWLRLPIKELKQHQPLFNVDGIKNKSRALCNYTDLQFKTGTQTTNQRFYLTWWTIGMLLLTNFSYHLYPFFPHSSWSCHHFLYSTLLTL